MTALALFSPIEHLALHSMLSFHLLQNVMLGDWAPPLFLLGLTTAMTRSLAQRRWVAMLANPSFALGFWLVVWYVSHIPVVYDYALRHQWALGFEHLAFVISGLAFWWPEIVPGYLSPIGKISYLAIAFLAISPLDLFVYLADHPLYSFYVHTPKLGGISALADQQIAGVAMAIESNVVLLTVIGFALMRLLSEEPSARGPGRCGLTATTSARARPLPSPPLPAGTAAGSRTARARGCRSDRGRSCARRSPRPGSWSCPSAPPGRG